MWYCYLKAITIFLAFSSSCDSLHRDSSENLLSLKNKGSLQSFDFGHLSNITDLKRIEFFVSWNNFFDYGFTGKEKVVMEWLMAPIKYGESKL